MVSFQCHSCGDVVKKPKLDQHRSRCHGGFDCIDCSTVFHSPAEYKMHTSCISEAEKYQKSLYKGPKSIGKRSDSEKNQQYGNYNQNYRNGFARGGGRPTWGAPRRCQVTGANDTPLGTPIRMSPVSRPVEVEEEKVEGAGTRAAQTEETLEKQRKDRKDKKEKDRVSKKEKDEKDNDKAARKEKEKVSKKEKDEKDKDKAARKEKDKKDRKRKAEDEGTRDDTQSSKKKTKVEEQVVDPLSSMKKDAKEEKEKDRKKKGKKQRASKMKEEETRSMAEGGEVREKRQKQKMGETMVSETSIAVNVDGNVEMASPGNTSNNDGKSQNSRDKKNKKNKQKISERDEDHDEEVIGSVGA